MRALRLKRARAIAKCATSTSTFLPNAPRLLSFAPLHAVDFALAPPPWLRSPLSVGIFVDHAGDLQRHGLLCLRRFAAPPPFARCRSRVARRNAQRERRSSPLSGSQCCGSQRHRRGRAVGALEIAYLSAARTQARLTTYAALPTAAEKWTGQHDFVYFAAAELLPSGDFPSTFFDNTDTAHCRLVVVRGIAHSAAAKAAWQHFMERPEVCVSFDLGRFGLAFFAPKLHKQHYVVAYL